jgi:MtN3 and saliva related transmembrane protein
MPSTPVIQEVIGYCAAGLTTLAFIPQALKSWRSRNLSSISLGMYSLFTLGVGLWLLYGLLLGSLPIILANAITLCLSGMVLTLKLQTLHKPQDTQGS